MRTEGPGGTKTRGIKVHVVCGTIVWLSVAGAAEAGSPGKEPAGQERSRARREGWAQAVNGPGYS